MHYPQMNLPLNMLFSLNSANLYVDKVSWYIECFIECLGFNPYK